MESVGNQEQNVITFGPIPSRRLGRSLGINNIPPKTCPYSCLYCQVGRTTRMTATRRPFYEPALVARQVEERIEKLREKSESVDYLTFVPDGEPTLDSSLGRSLDLLKPLGIGLAVISNSSLIWDASVREDLKKADWISLKLDTADEKCWRDLNRPHGSLSLQAILEGLVQFSTEFKGELVTETMLVKDINTGESQLRQTADFLAQIKPTKAYLSVPTRPPAERWVEMPDEQNLATAYQILSERLHTVECLTGYEGDSFASTGDLEKDLLAITAVHPMRESAVHNLLEKGGVDWSIVNTLVSNGRLIRTEYRGKTFYLRSLTRVGTSSNR